MAYAELDFYMQSFYGEILTEANFHKWISLASDELDTLTFGRLITAFPANEIHASKIKKAACAVAETLYLIDEQRKAVCPQKGADGAYKNPISSVSSGRESVSYAVNNVNSSVYASAVADMSVRDNLIRGIAVKYLANIPDANGVNLLYAGVS